MHSPLLHRYSVFLLFCVLILIIAGGLVTSTESGLSVPDWPLSYGQFFPPMIGGIRFEHTHRVIAGIVGILTLILTILTLKYEKRRWVKTAGVAASFAVLLQALLGGLTVIYLLPPAISIAHACLGQTFFALIAVIALVTSKSWIEGLRTTSEEAVRVQRLALMTSGFVYTQLILGATVRHTGAAALLWHIGVAFLVLLHALLTTVKAGSLEKDPQGLYKHSVFMGLFVLCQMFLGLGAYYFTLHIEKAAMPRTAEVLLTTAHQSLGALILATSITLSLRVCRHLTKNAS